jgi:hypothetical protein
LVDKVFSKISKQQVGAIETMRLHILNSSQDFSGLTPDTEICYIVAIFGNGEQEVSMEASDDRSDLLSHYWLRGVHPGSTDWYDRTAAVIETASLKDWIYIWENDKGGGLNHYERIAKQEFLAKYRQALSQFKTNN